MSFEVVKNGTLEYLVSTLLDTPHCFSTRRGGVSEDCFSSLNLGLNRGDPREHCLKNYQILGRAVGFSAQDTVFSRQIHSSLVQQVGQQDRGCGFSPETAPRDGMITQDRQVALTVFGADCTPVLLYDPVHRAVGAVHSGWRGTAAGIVYQAVLQMQRAFGTEPAKLRAAIGPCIGPCCFETHEEVPQAMQQALPRASQRAICSAETPGKYHVDLKRLNAAWLRRAGVRIIDICPDCTACQPDRYWSHRRMGEARGTQAAIILLS